MFVSLQKPNYGDTTYEYGFWYYCTKAGDVWIASYDNAKCDGLAISQGALLDEYPSGSVNDLTVNAACKKEPCQYVTVETSSEAIDCHNEESYFGAYTSYPFIAGHCTHPIHNNAHSEIWRCSNGVATHEYHYDAECGSDDPWIVDHDTSLDIDCEDIDTSTVGTMAFDISVECGIATFAGRLNEENSDEANPIVINGTVSSQAYHVNGAYAVVFGAVSAIYHAF